MNFESKIDGEQLLGRIALTVAAAEKRAAEANESLRPYYLKSAREEQQAYDLIKELVDAAADFLHCESCDYNAMAIVAPRNRLRNVLGKFGGAA